ncbi:hypothetical protein Hanom_Chr03g00210091 [Helianthus anomalus]
MIIYIGVCVYEVMIVVANRRRRSMMIRIRNVVYDTVTSRCSFHRMELDKYICIYIYIYTYIHTYILKTWYLK